MTCRQNRHSFNGQGTLEEASIFQSFQPDCSPPQAVAKVWTSNGNLPGQQIFVHLIFATGTRLAQRLKMLSLLNPKAEMIRRGQALQVHPIVFISLVSLLTDRIR